MTPYLPSVPFMSGSTCYRDISFSLVSPAQSNYAKYNQNRHVILNQIVLWTLEYRHIFLAQSMDLKLDKKNLNPRIPIWITALKENRSL